MALPHVNAGELITSAAWNNMVDEFNTKVNKVGDGIIAGSLSINGLLKANKLEITDAATGVSFPDSWIGMANNIDGASKWLHIGGITDSGARRIALFASKSYFSGNVGIQTVNPADALDVAGGTRTRSLTFTMANNTGNGMSIVRSANTMDVSMGTAGFLLPNSPPLTYTFRVGHHGLLILGGGDSFVTKFSVDQAGNSFMSGNLGFGATTRQMLNLWNAEYGIGVQNSTLYFRSFDAFYWYKGGVHDNNRGVNSGGGREMMSLQGDGRLLLTNGAGSIGQVSDKRLKKNIKPLENALDKLTQLQGVTFQWKEPELRGGDEEIQTGMIAQEVEKVFPHWVREYGNQKSIAMPGFEALVVESLKELKAEINKIKEHLKI